MRIPFFISRFALAAALLFSAAPFSAESRAELIEDIVSRGKLRVGLSSFKPWAMRDKRGEFVGFEPEVARALAEDMGVELELAPTKWDGIIPALLAGKFDIIISGMFVTPARNLKVAFTLPYERSGLEMTASRELAGDFRQLSDFNRDDVVFALRRGAQPVAFVRENLPKAQIRQFDEDISALQEVINGRAHAFINAAPQPTFAALDHPEKLFLPVDGLLSTALQGMAIRRGEHDAMNFFNNWIRVRTETGWLQTRHDYWFKTRDWAELVE